MTNEPKVPFEGDSENFSVILYDQITSVIGGDNSNQFFCMRPPGMIF